MSGKGMDWLEPDGRTLHGCAVEICGTGILIIGSSSAGKTSLCHGLIDHFTKLDKLAMWVGDDHVIPQIHGGELTVRAPEAIAGKAELYGYGIVSVEYKDETVIALCVRLVDDDAIERMPETREITAAVDDQSVALPLLEAPERHESHAIRLVAAKLSEILPATTLDRVAPGGK